MTPIHSKSVGADDGTTTITVLDESPEGTVVITIDRGDEGYIVSLAPGAAAYLAGCLATKAGVMFYGAS